MLMAALKMKKEMSIKDWWGDYFKKSRFTFDPNDLELPSFWRQDPATGRKWWHRTYGVNNVGLGAKLPYHRNHNNLLPRTCLICSDVVCAPSYGNSLRIKRMSDQLRSPDN